MVEIRGAEEFSLAEMAIESTYGTPETSGFLAFRIVDESLTVATAELPGSAEMGVGGGIADLDVGRSIVEGSIIIEGKFNAAHVWRFICHAMGGMEIRHVGHMPDGSTTGQTDHATHLFVLQSYSEQTAGSVGAVPPGITLRIWKSGADTSGKVDVYSGALITSWSWQQDEGNSEPTLTLNFIAQPEPQLAASSGGTPSFQSVRALGLRDLSRPHPAIATLDGQIGFGIGTVDFNVDSFRIDVDSHLGYGQSFLNNINELRKPGHSAQWSVSGSLTARLQQDYFSFSAWAFYLQGLQDVLRGGFRVRYTGAEVAGSTPLDMLEVVQLDLPKVVIQVADHALSEAGEAPVSFEFVGEEGVATSIAGPDSYNTQLAVQCNVKIDSDGDSGANFCTPAEGGNPAPLKVV